jgi:hypothetical protein
VGEHSTAVNLGGNGCGVENCQACAQMGDTPPAYLSNSEKYELASVALDRMLAKAEKLILASARKSGRGKRRKARAQA